MAGLPNGISCTNGQHTEGNAVHTFPLKEKDRNTDIGLKNALGLILVMTSCNGYQNSHLVPQNKR